MGFFCKVVEKKENLPVYRIRNLHKKSDERVVHRNLLMLCTELPLDVFEEAGSERKKDQKTKKIYNQRDERQMENIPDEDNSEYGEFEVIMQQKRQLVDVPEGEIGTVDGDRAIVEEPNSEIVQDGEIGNCEVKNSSGESAIVPEFGRSAVDRESHDAVGCEFNICWR